MSSLAGVWSAGVLARGWLGGGALVHSSRLVQACSPGGSRVRRRKQKRPGGVSQEPARCYFLSTLVVSTSQHKGVRKWTPAFDGRSCSSSRGSRETVGDRTGALGPCLQSQAIIQNPKQHVCQPHIFKKSSLWSKVERFIIHQSLQPHPQI